ncbi:MAG: 30S ribosomal protein S18 [Anaerolineae bacterium]
MSEENNRDQRSRSSSEGRNSSGGDRRSRSSRGRFRSGGRGRRPRSTACTSRCVGRQVENLNYKQVDALERYVTDRGKIRSRRQTGNCAKHQRVLARAIKRARFMALLPYTADHSFTSDSR